METNILEFPITVFGNIEKYNETLSKARCAIFYKGKNRNGSFISDEFADKLIQTIAYAPVKGIYDENDEDYTDHGDERDLGRIYGVVPESYNFAWEKRLDKDGVEREYACVDVLLYTALYEEAGSIVGKAQSMELYGPSIKGDWGIIDGQRYFVFTEGSFLGLQVLGDDVEPCFEGAAFFQLMDRMEQLLKRLDTYQFNLEDSNEGGNNMPEINFKLSDNAKANLIFFALNPNFCEEGQWVMDFGIEDIYDDYALVYACDKRKHYRVYYTKNDENESVVLGDMVECFIVDVTESEKTTLETLQKLNNGTYDKLDEVFNTYKEVEEKVSEFEQKIEEQVETISTLNTEKATLESDNATLTENYTVAQSKIAELEQYKANKEDQEKNAVIDKYAVQLDEEVISKYREKVSEFTMIDLEKELAFELVQSKPAIFANQKEQQLIPLPEEEATGIAAILEKYRK